MKKESGRRTACLKTIGRIESGRYRVPKSGGGPMKRVTVVIFVVTVSLGAGNVDGQLSPTNAQSCATLASLALPDTVITIAQPVAAGTFIPPTPFSAAGPRG